MSKNLIAITVLGLLGAISGSGKAPTLSETDRPGLPGLGPPINDAAIFQKNVKDIYFDYERYSVRSDAAPTLKHSASVIADHPKWVVQIQGNCDQRERNASLGEKRARAASDFLIDAGVKAIQIKTISNGRNKPVCVDEDESCFQRNRRDHFVLLRH